MENLKNKTAGLSYYGKIVFINEDIRKINIICDVVFFEFCLHEIENPAETLDMAAKTAPFSLIIDHAPDSEWSWRTCETEKLSVSRPALLKRKIIRETRYEDAAQSFADYNALYARLSFLGGQCLNRLEEFKTKKKYKHSYAIYYFSC